MKEQRFTYRKHEKLKSRKLTDVLFSSGKTIQQYPLKVFYTMNASEETSFKAGVGVSKRYFKKAVDRNRIKRLLREALRLNKHMLSDTPNTELVMFVLYTDKEMPAFELLQEKLRSAFTVLKKKMHANS